MKEMAEVGMKPREDTRPFEDSCLTQHQGKGHGGQEWSTLELYCW